MRHFLAGANILTLSALFLFFLAPTITPSSAQQRQLFISPDTDFPGGDYKTLKQSGLDACKAACLADNQCKAFTFNRTAQWCFLKSAAGKQVTAEGAVSGRIQIVTAFDATRAARRRTELSFVPAGDLAAAGRLLGALQKRYDPAGMALDALRQAGKSALQTDKFAQAVGFYGRALVLDPHNREIWTRFALAVIEIKPNKRSNRLALARLAANAAINGYLRGAADNERAVLLAIMGRAFERRAMWKPAIRSYRASLALRETPLIRAAYDNVIAKRGFRITSHEVDAESLNPRICIKLSDKLPARLKNLSDFVTVGRPGLAVEPKGSQICIDGVKHGQRYAVTLRAGLPSYDGEKLPKTARLEIYVRDRAPWVGFAGKAYILPRGKNASIPIVSVNTDRIKATIYRIGTRGVTSAIRSGLFLRQLYRSDASDIANQRGEQVWQGEIEVTKTANRNVTTAVPITDALKTVKSGIYVMTARPALGGKNRWGPLATQWFMISDLGLTMLKGQAGVHGFVRSLGSAKPLAEVTVKLVAVNDEILGSAKSNANGYVRFAPGLARGKGGMAPRLLIAQSPTGDYALLDFAKPSFDLTDRGVGGRAAPKPLDVFVTAERGVYRPGETVYLTGLVRDARARAVKNLPLTLIVRRPDGVEAGRSKLKHGGLGGYVHEYPLHSSAMRGSWRLAIHADPKQAALAETKILVEDFEPERLAFELKSKLDRFDPANPIPVELSARYLYGAPAQGLAIETEIKVTPLKQSPSAYPGYRFGLDNEGSQGLREPVVVSAQTDQAGKAAFNVPLPRLARSTRLFEATIITRLADSNGRAVERTLTRPIRADGPRIGIKPLFDNDTVSESGPARFEVIVISPDGRRLNIKGLAWTLERIETDFQWYRADGRWKYEPVTNARRIANGTFAADADGPVKLDMPVKWGRYRLTVKAGDIMSSVKFDAGWHAATGAAETPDFLDVSLDRKTYNIGDTARVRIKPRFAGTALISVIDNRLIETRTVEMPTSGAVVDLKITRDWGPGAYVTVMLFRPMDIEARRMPARALGLKWLKIAPAGRKLDLALTLPKTIRPRGNFDVPLTISNLKPGTEAYVTVAAVDLGILNLTRFKPPAPDKYYFGQRKLGVEIRDLYGQLIDIMRGIPGRVRSGGDVGAEKLQAAPPTQKLVALFSGPVRVDDKGRARVSFDLPDFNGTVRVMAMAWSKTGAGHAAKDVIVRDQVVVTASAPRFLAPGDKSRLHLEIFNADGPAGDYAINILADGGLQPAGPAGKQTVSLARNERRTVTVPISAKSIGPAELAIELTTPDGKVLPKSVNLDVRPAHSPVTQRRIVKLAAKSGRLVLDREVLDHLMTGTGRATLSVSPAGALDVPGLLHALDRYPYGCTEQITSRALPLVYLDDVAVTVGLGADKAIRKRVRDAIAGVLANQSSGGGFGLWRPGGGDLWLDAYVTDFLTRARQKGYAVPELAYRQALDNLANRVAYSNNLARGGEALAYALYVMARNGRATIGDLRYFAETRLAGFASPLAKAQLGAALALYGDPVRSKTAFAAALGDLTSRRRPAGIWRVDYGTRLRDRAAILTLAAETRQAGVDLGTLAKALAAQRETVPRTSTQENAWMLLAAHALISDAAKLDLRIDGASATGTLFRRFKGTRLAAKPVIVENRSAQPISAVITTTGVPKQPLPAGGRGLAIERAYFRPDGTPADLSGIRQNDRFVVVVKVRIEQAFSGRLMIVDRLPAGFEIENPNLTQSGDVSRYKWLKISGHVSHTEARFDRFVAALDRKPGSAREITLAYTVRAVTPGSFVHPAALVEDMYRPQQRARTASGRIVIAGPNK
jgi:uncharacterized protein YfaS (alpha-2-macroglobulin family)